MDSVDGDTMLTRFAVLTSIGDERFFDHDLWLLLERKASPVCYVWFKPSPEMDIADGILMTMHVNKLIGAGLTVKIFMADWFAHRKLVRVGSDADKMRAVAAYNVEVWKAAGMDLGRVELVWFSDELARRPPRRRRLLAARHGRRRGQQPRRGDQAGEEPGPVWAGDGAGRRGALP
ncbi:hypothetical protein ACP70R_027487 [Stipagrostis hirtigluma subsp. patula]